MIKAGDLVEVKGLDYSTFLVVQLGRWPFRCGQAKVKKPNELDWSDGMWVPVGGLEPVYTDAEERILRELGS